MKLKRNAGFSLVEILVVLVIMGLLISVVAPTVLNQADDARMLELLEPYRGQRARVQGFAKAAGAPPRRGPRLALVDIKDR